MRLLKSWFPIALAILWVVMAAMAMADFASFNAATAPRRPPVVKQERPAFRLVPGTGHAPPRDAQLSVLAERPRSSLKAWTSEKGRGARGMAACSSDGHALAPAPCAHVHREDAVYSGSGRSSLFGRAAPQHSTSYSESGSTPASAAFSST